MTLTDADLIRFSRHADAGECEYCGASGLVKPDPFGQRPACAECWYLIIDGEDAE